MSALLLAVDGLNDRLVAADAIGEAFDLAAGENPPAWVHVFRSQVEFIRVAAEAVETLVRGGMGVVTPMETLQRPAVSTSRVLPVTPARVRATRPD